MNELRILNGKKKGASIGLSEGLLQIGSGPESILMISPEEIGDAKATISTSAANDYSLNEVIGEIRRLDGTASQVEDLLKLDQSIKIGDIWLTIAKPSSPWAEAPERFLTVEKAVSTTTESSETAQTDAINSESKDKEIKPKKTLRPTGFNMLIIVLLSVGLANYAHSRKKNTASADAPIQLLLEQQKQDQQALLQKNIESEKQFELSKTIVRKMLQEREIENLVVAGDIGEITIEGNLNNQRIDTLERMLKRMKSTHPDINISVNTSSVEESLPFNIVSIAFGANSKLFLENHGVLAIGQTIMGYRLESITQEKINFSGTQKLAISW